MERNSDFWIYIYNKLQINQSCELKDLFNKLLEFNPTSRINLEEIFQHKWIISNETPSYQEVVYEMDRRRERVKKGIQNHKRSSIISREEIHGTEIFNKMRDSTISSSIFGEKVREDKGLNLSIGKGGYMDF